VSLLRRLSGRAGREGAVPGWGDLDVPWRRAEFVVLDLETTGLDLRRDEIVSYRAVTVRGGRAIGASAVYGLVRPARPVTRAAVEVHALRLEDLEHAPPLVDCARVLADLLRGRVLVAHAAWVEQAFLGRALRAGGVRLDGPVVDTAALAREALVVRERDEGEPDLERLVAGMGLPVHTPHHALVSAVTTATCSWPWSAGWSPATLRRCGR
jgi:DNA polymerase-3 subunit epsilon